MTTEDIKRLTDDPDGLITYEYIANHIEDCDDDMKWLIGNVVRVDRNGQFSASAARYLNAIDHDKYSEEISMLVDATIGKDREHRYLTDLMVSIYGPDFHQNAKDLISKDDNFRRIYKRLYPENLGYIV